MTFDEQMRRLLDRNEAFLESMKRLDDALADLKSSQDKDSRTIRRLAQRAEAVMKSLTRTEDETARPEARLQSDSSQTPLPQS